jgi:hypothetical protein
MGKHNDSQQQEHQVKIIKDVVQFTFEAMTAVKTRINELNKEKQALKRDLIDMKEGRLDRIQERHAIDPVSKDVSIFSVERKVEIGKENASPWYVPYLIHMKDKDGNAAKLGEINNSVLKINAGGSYQLNNGEVKYL